jgi:AraC-like DNA-binding protein
MKRIDSLVRDLTGVGLMVVWSTAGGHRGQVSVAGSDAELPSFCRMLHEEPRGLEQCVTCHSLLALAARNQGKAVEGRCQGGALVVAAPAMDAGLPPDTDIMVLSSCAIGMRDRRQGWRLTRQTARDLGVDLARLRHAYEKLPMLRGERLKLVTHLVEAGVATLTEALRSRLAAQASRTAEPESRDIEEKFRQALRHSRDAAFRNTAGSPHRTLVDVVATVVSENPQLPVSVADIARAARITPNHFSLIFRRQMGTPFSAFLAEKRLVRAEERLGDLTLSIGQVARQCGFSDPNYFAKVFRRQTGTSPHQWRMQPKHAAPRSNRRQPVEKFND